MNEEPKHNVFGTPLSIWISQIPGELPVDAVGLWQFVPAGRDNFGLLDEELVAYVRRCLHALLDRGAKPVRMREGKIPGSYAWQVEKHYGETNHEIVEAVIAEWRASGKDPDAGGLWFALPKMYEVKKESP